MKLELISTDKIADPMIWVKLFMKAQGCKITHNILYQDYKISILLENDAGRIPGRGQGASTYIVLFDRSNEKVEHMHQGLPN